MGGVGIGSGPVVVVVVGVDVGVDVGANVVAGVDACVVPGEEDPFPEQDMNTREIHIKIEITRNGLRNTFMISSFFLGTLLYTGKRTLT